MTQYTETLETATKHREACVLFCFVLVLFGVFCFFFFQAEDGIRDVAVTGVQTCALPIYIGLERRYD